MSALDSAGAPTVRNNRQGAMSREKGHEIDTARSAQALWAE